jgi:tetratricopeptide (TPR) repeat protein
MDTLARVRELIEAGRAAEALPLAESIADEAPGALALVCMALARASWAEGDLTRANQFLERADQHAHAPGERAAVVLTMAEFAAGIGEHESAIQLYNGAWQQSRAVEDPAHQAALEKLIYAGLAVAYEQIGDHEKARNCRARS